MHPIKSDRITQIEQALQHFEGAHYALHDMVAFMLTKVPEPEARAMLQRLADQVSVHADKVGKIRLSGYTEELESVRSELGYSRTEDRGLFKRLAGAIISERNDDR